LVEVNKGLTPADIRSSVTPEQAAETIMTEGSVAGVFQQSAIIPMWERDIAAFRELPKGEIESLRVAREIARKNKTYLG